MRKSHIARIFNQVADRYDAVAVLQQEVGRRLLERLALIKLNPELILDVGSGTGSAISGLAARYPEANIIELDISIGMLTHVKSRGVDAGFICADVEALPLRSGVADLVIANFLFEWCSDLGMAIIECRRALKPGGLLIFTTLGPDTFQELRQSWASVDSKPHVHSFIDMHDMGDALMQAHFADPVMDLDYFTLTYPSVSQLFAEFKALGMRNLEPGRQQGFMGKQHFQRFVAAYETHRNAEGRLPLTYEVVYGLAWKPMSDRKDSSGEVRISIEKIRRS